MGEIVLDSVPRQLGGTTAVGALVFTVSDRHSVSLSGPSRCGE